MFELEQRSTIYLVQAPEGAEQPPLFTALSVVPGGFTLISPWREVRIRSPDGDDAVTHDGRWITLKDEVTGAEWKLREMREGDAEWDQLGLTPAEAYEMCVTR
jgi:hypothetical protein